MFRPTRSTRLGAGALLLALSVTFIAPSFARCDDLRDPLAYSLGNKERRSEVQTDLGVFTLKWSRASEAYFGRNPERALAEAAQTVRRALLQASFAPELKSLSQDWSVVMLDEATAQRELSGSLASNCHPGWMVPPSNIYIVAERAAQYCGGKEVPAALADRRLAQILIHEIGHAVEFKLMGRAFSGDRMRAEGFASWFEQFASEYSSFIPKGFVRAEYRKFLTPDLFQPGWQFGGGAGDYARAALFFEVVEKKRGVAGIMELYRGKRSVPFWDNYLQELSVSPVELDKKLADLARR